MVSSATNVAYLTGFTGDSSVLLVSRERELLISDGRFTTQIEQECPGLEAYIRPSTQTLNQAIVHVAGSLGVERLGFEAAILSVADFQTIREAMAGVTLVPTTDRVELLRQIKDEQEIEAIREAIAFAEKAFQMLPARVAGGGQREGNRRLAGSEPAAVPDGDRFQLSANRRRGISGRLASRTADGDIADRR